MPWQQLTIHMNESSSHFFLSFAQFHNKKINKYLNSTLQKVYRLKNAVVLLLIRKRGHENDKSECIIRYFFNTSVNIHPQLTTVAFWAICLCLTAIESGQLSEFWRKWRKVNLVYSSSKETFLKTGISLINMSRNLPNYCIADEWFTGRTSTNEAEHSKRPVEVGSPETIDRLYELVWVDRRLKVPEIENPQAYNS